MRRRQQHLPRRRRQAAPAVAVQREPVVVGLGGHVEHVARGGLGRLGQPAQVGDEHQRAVDPAPAARVELGVQPRHRVGAGGRVEAERDAEPRRQVAGAVERLDPVDRPRQRQAGIAQREGRVRPAGEAPTRPQDPAAEPLALEPGPAEVLDAGDVGDRRRRAHLPGRHHLGRQDVVPGHLEPGPVVGQHPHAAVVEVDQLAEQVGGRAVGQASAHHHPAAEVGRGEPSVPHVPSPPLLDLPRGRCDTLARRRRY